MPHSGRCRRQTQCLGGFGVGKLFEVPHQQDLAVILDQVFDRFVKPQLQFPSDRSGGRCQFGIGQPCHQVQGALVRVSPGRQGSLTIDAASLGLPVAAVHIDQAVAGKLSQPQMKGKSGLGKIFAESVRSFQQHILDHIAGVDTATDRPVHTMMNQFSQRITMAVHQSLDGILVAVSRRGKQFPGTFRVGPDTLRIG